MAVLQDAANMSFGTDCVIDCHLSTLRDHVVQTKWYNETQAKGPASMTKNAEWVVARALSLQLIMIPYTIFLDLHGAKTCISRCLA